MITSNIVMLRLFATPSRTTIYHGIGSRWSVYRCNHSASTGSHTKTQSEEVEEDPRLNANALPFRDANGKTFRANTIYTTSDLDDTEFGAYQETPTLANINFDVFNAMKKDPLKEYKDKTLLSYFITETGNLMNRRQTSLTAKNQRKLTKAVKRARTIGLLPYLYRPDLPRFYRKANF